MRYLILALLCLIAVIAYVQRSIPMFPETIERDLDLGDRTMGLVMGVWYWGYAFLQIPAGWCADRFGSRRTLVAAAILWSALTAVTGFATGTLTLMTAWTLMGAAQAGVFPAAARSIRIWFGAHQRALAAGTLAASMAIGIALGPRTTATLLYLDYSWRDICLIYAIPGVLWAIVYLFVVPREPPSASIAAPVKIPLGAIFRSSTLWLLCGQQFLRAAAMVLFGSWYPRFLQETRGFSQLDAGRMAAWAGVGAMIGGLLGGAVADGILALSGNRRWSRQGVAIAGVGTAAAAFALAPIVADAHLAVALMSFGALAATFGGVSGYSVAIDFGGPHVGKVFSIMNTCGNIGAGVFPYLVGGMVQAGFGWNVVIHLIVGIFIVDAILWALLNPNATLAGRWDGALTCPEGAVE